MIRTGAGRPRGTAVQATERKAEILRNAAIVFAEQGYTGASTRQIAAAAGVNIGTLAYHFGDKEGLYLAVLDHLYGQLLVMEFPELSGLLVEERVRTVMIHLYAFVRRRKNVVRVLLRHVMEHGRLPDAVRERWMGRTLERVGELEMALDIGSLAEKQLPLLSLNHLLARYVVTDPKDLEWIAEGTEIHSQIANHLADVAVLLLCVHPD